MGDLQPSVLFRFKADHQFEPVELAPGQSSVGVEELREIVTNRRLNGSAGAFGLKLSNSQTGEGMPRAVRLR